MMRISFPIDQATAGMGELPCWGWPAMERQPESMTVTNSN